MLTSTCASRRSGVHFLNISISKSAPNLRCFVVFDFQMCCAPATACAFWTSQLPKMLREWCALRILTSKCASRHNASTSQLPKSGPNMRCFAHFDFEMCFAPQHRPAALAFRPSGATNHWNNTVNRDFSTFSRLFLFSDSSHLCFSMCPYCRKLDFSKLPSVNQPLIWVNNG